MHQRPNVNPNKILARYDYSFPRQLIAQKPASPRDLARLLVYRRATDAVFFDVFRNIARHLPQRAILVFNETKVIPARLAARKETGGLAHILFVRKAGSAIEALSNRKLPIGSVISVAGKPKTRFSVSGHKGGLYLLKPLFPLRELENILVAHGKTPVPPYLKRTPLSERDLRKKYQSVFARIAGSIAAPTASLHFTKRLLWRLRAQGFGIEFITLHVNLGTFAPLTTENLSSGMLHEERYRIGKKTAERLNRYKREGLPIIVVGTTVVRALESAAGAKGVLRRLSGKTRLFIREGCRFRFVDGIITNFHVPRSSLLMLVAAFAGREKLLALYRKAMRKKFRLFSFGDGMFIV